MNELKKCALCSCLPKLHIRNYAKTINDNTIVSHYLYQCDDCTLKYLEKEGVCTQTFEWHTEDKAREEWNGIVDNNNSWYTKDYQLLHPLQTTLYICNHVASVRHRKH